MDSESTAVEETGVLPRLLAAGVGVVCRFPWTVLALVVLSCAACAYYTFEHLAYLTHRNDLISKKKDYLKRWHQYVEEFGDDEDMIVVVRGNDRQQMELVLENLAARIETRPDSFDRLFYKVDLRSLESRALLFLPTEQIRLVQNHVQGMSLLLEPPVLGTLDPWFGWRSLSLVQLLRESERRLSAWNPEHPSKDAEDFLLQLDAILHCSSDSLTAPERYKSPWRTPLPEGPSVEVQQQLTKPQYFFSKDGSLAFLLVSPVKDQDSKSFAYARERIDTLRTIVAEVQAQHTEVELGLTGLPVLENDEMLASQSDSSLASWLALLGVTLLYLVVYRGWRYPFITVAALLVGTIWALGWLTLTVGHLNILSSAFAVMLIGMGDYGVLWVTRFTQERQFGLSVPEAMHKTALCIGPSIATAAITTAFAFFATTLADLRAVAELGWIAGCGVLLCALSCFLVVPAFLTLFDARVQLTDTGMQAILSLEEHRQARREWIPWLLRRPRWVFTGSILASLALAFCAARIDYDHNLLNMQAQELASVRWQKTLIEHTSDSSWHAVSWTTTPEESLALKSRYELLPTVSSVHTLASLVPLDQDRKIEIARDIQHRLRKLPRRGEIIEHAPPGVADLESTASRVLNLLARIRKDSANATLDQLQGGIESFLSSLAAARADPRMPQKLKQYEEWMTRDLAEDLHRLRDVSTPAQIALTDLPACLRGRYIGKNGKWLVRIFSKECLWNFGPLEQFIAQVRTVDPEATGKPFTTLEGLKGMRNGFLWAGVYALIAMVIVLFIDFGTLKHTFVALLPLALGMIATLGFMALLGVSLNPANMIAFPLILGVGADNGVHVLHDFRSRDRSRRYRLGHATGRGIMVAALTTILGFGTLMIAQHRGMASLGLILTVGVTCCMTTALVFLPAMLHVLGKRQKARDQSASEQARTAQAA